MDIQSLHYQFQLNKDRITTLSTQDFNRAEIDWLLNEAQLIFIKTRMTPHNQYRVGFENTQKRIDDLSTLVVTYPLQDFIVPTNHNGVYEVDLGDLTYQYLFFLAGYTDITDPESSCSYTNAKLKFIQHDDYRDVIRDPFNNASRESIPYNFGRASSGNSAIYLYPGNYTIDKVYVEYLKYPQKVSLGNYTYIDGITYPPTTLELPEHTHSEIVDIACQIAALAIESPEYIQLKTQKVFMHE